MRESDRGARAGIAPPPAGTGAAPRPAPVPRQSQLDERAVPREAISDEFDVSTLLDVDDQLSSRQPGIGADVTRKLRQGHWSIQGQLDLHGLRTEDARAALATFIRAARQQGLRCVRIVHGKGLGSPRQGPGAQAQGAWLAGAEERDPGFCAGAAGTGRLRGAGGAVAVLGARIVLARVVQCRREYGIG